MLMKVSLYFLIIYYTLVLFNTVCTLYLKHILTSMLTNVQLVT